MESRVPQRMGPCSANEALSQGQFRAGWNVNMLFNSVNRISYKHVSDLEISGKVAQQDSSFLLVPSLFTALMSAASQT